MIPGLKAAAVRLLTTSRIANAFRPLTRDVAVVFMLHRFADPERDVPGYDPAALGALLAYLRRERYELVGLDALLESLRGDGAPLRHTVVFTMDDGYVEQATVAGSVFAEFDCPVTTFVTTGFLDRTLWFWWDKVEYVFTHAASRTLTVETGEGSLRYALADATSRRAAQQDFTTRCKGVPDHGKHAMIQELARVAEVSLDGPAPARYTPMTWEQLRACERRGMTFGPHTVTHPILARTDEASARREITESWGRLRAEAQCPIPVFAYPNGQTGDFGDREFRVLEKLGLSGVTGVAGFATARRYERANGPFLIPRFAFPDSLPYLVQQVGGLERFKFLLRGSA